MLLKLGYFLPGLEVHLRILPDNPSMENVAKGGKTY